MRQLYKTQFVWLIPNDDNRMMDGLDLRHEFLKHERIDPDSEWLSLGCSVLEMLIALSRALSFTANEGGARDWFWVMMHNAGLTEYNDAEPYSEDEVSEIVERIIWRTYNPDGTGGLFPLEYPDQNQQ